jgi:soluble lytic murein transglycosylase
MACAGNEGETAVSLPAESTATLMPTPTLVPALAAAEPTATATAASFVAALVDKAIAQIIPTHTPPPSPTPSPTPLPTATPRPEVRIEQARELFHNGNYAAVIEQLEAALPHRSSLSVEQEVELLYTLGRAYVRADQSPAAINVLNDLLSATAGEGLPAAYFYLGQAQEAAGNDQAAVTAYEAYLASEPIMAAYIQPRIAQLLEGEAAVAAYEAALSGQAHRLKVVDIRLQLARFYMDAGNYQAAITQYDAVHDLAQTEQTRGQMTYLAGTALLLAGDTEGGYDRYQFGLTNYPRAYESYLGLVALVEAGIFVDEYQRGLVDYYAEVYEPAIGAFGRYISANPTTYNPDAHLYLAWCYEALGDVASAYTELEKYGRVEAATATIEQAKIAARTGDRATAVDLYGSYLHTYPDGADAPFAAWWLAALTERLGDVTRAISYYEALAAQYPQHEDAPEALFRAGWLAQLQGEAATAVSFWLRLAESYPASEFASAARVWLLRTLPEIVANQATEREVAAAGILTPPVAISPSVPITSIVDITPTVEITPTPAVTPLLDYTAVLSRVETLVMASTGDDYYAVRAQNMVNGRAPFEAEDDFMIPEDETADQQAAEQWLRNWLGLAEDADVRSLSPTLAEDPRLIVGSHLWELGLWDEAKRELESLRSDHAENTLFSYQLALYFRDLGLYRSSIVAASSVLFSTGQSVFEAPSFISRLAFPTYYHDLILPLADHYGYDPRLQFALVRQESLFESFARSGAAAQGLSQVIPDTGAYIAGQLNWPDFENADLYLPYVGLNFGAFYLAQQLNAFDEQVHVALSAYNAGPGNAARWYTRAGTDLDSFHETVDFNETRLYIERIYVGFVVYDYLYNES